MDVLADFAKFNTLILQMEQEGMVTRTFRRLDPEKQHAVLTAIIEEAVQKGPTSINIKQVAKRAGVSVGSLYTYFQYQPYLMAMPLREGLTGYIAGGVEWGQLQSGLTQFFLKAAFHGDPELGEKFVRPMGVTLLGIVRGMLQEAINRGEVRGDIDLEGTTRMVHALTIALGDSQMMPYLNNYLQLSDEEVPIERVIVAMLDTLMEGIAPRKDS
jgi:AcrR family transcriptional regulator